MAQITLNLDTEAALEQYAVKVSVLLDTLHKDQYMRGYTGRLETELKDLQKAIYRARMLKNCSVSVDIDLINRMETALVEYVEN